jgi:hypothetical protein
MKLKFKEMITTSLAEAMPAILRGIAEALKADRKFDEDSSKHSRSKKSVEKPKPRDKTLSDSDSSFHDSEDRSYHGSSPSSENPSDKPRGKKHRETKSDKSDSKSCTYRNFLAYKPEIFKGDKSATDALRWIEKMETTIDVSG